MRLLVKCRFISQYIQEWLSNHKQTEAAPKELIQYLVDKKVYTTYALRCFHRDLRNLENRNMLSALEGIEIKKINNRYRIIKK